MNTTQTSLLLRLKQPGADEAWGRFVDLYTPLLFFWARRCGLRVPDDADFVQDVFLTLLEKLPRFNYDQQKSFRGWLHTVVINKWRDRCRQLAPVGPLPDDDIADPRDSEPGGRFWEEEHQRYLVARALEIMRAEFPEKTWKACWELVVNGRPAREVAAELGLAESTVYVCKLRVIRRLREELEGMLD